MKKTTLTFEDEYGIIQTLELSIHRDGIIAACNGVTAQFPVKRDPRALAAEIYELAFTGDDKYHRAAKVSEITDWLTDGDGGAARSAADLAKEWIEYDQEPEKAE